MLRKNSYRRAVGLTYDSEGITAPQVSLSVERKRADAVVKAAQRFAVPIVENPSLAIALSDIQLEHEIPQELFEAVAILLHEL